MAPESVTEDTPVNTPNGAVVAYTEASPMVEPSTTKPNGDGAVVAHADRGKAFSRDERNRQEKASRQLKFPR
jgi:hypothetical protein